MKGGRCKTRNIKPKKRQRKNVATDTISSPRAKKSRSDDQASLNLSTCFPTTPKRSKRLRGQQRDVILTSTPVRSSSSVISHPSPQINEVQLQCLKVSSKAKTSEGGSQSISRSQSGRKRRCSKSRKVEQKSAMCQPTGVNGSTAKQPRGRLRKTENGSLKGNTLSKPCKFPRPRFELQMPDTSDHDESLLSSDLSIELSQYEEQLPSLSFQEDETSDDQEEELPSFLMPKDTRPSAITDRAFAWCKFRNYPFWPAWVKSVNRKQKKASIIFVDGTLADNHGKKGFTVALKSLKPFDCEESEELTHKAKETYEAAVSWSLELIDDYIIRIACGSFSGSFIEYVNHAMSYPVRRKHPQAASERLTIASDSMTVESCDDLKEDSINENKEVRTSTKRLLPDRTLAAYNRANEKLVHFIVKQRMVEPRLLAVIHGQQQSRWLRSFLSAKRKRVVNIYLEDDQQLDQVYQYLNELCTTATSKSSCLLEMKPLDQVPFVLDVLLPEAIIYAIAGVDNVSVKKAEEKYLNGRCLSNREKEEFDLMIEHQMRRKEHQSSAADMLSDVIN